MQEQIQKDTKTPWLWYTGLALTALSVLILTTIYPIGYWLPVSVTEKATVIANVEAGCVVDSSFGYPITVSPCSARSGDVIEFSYNVPAIHQSGYFQKIQEKVDLVTP